MKLSSLSIIAVLAVTMTACGSDDMEEITAPHVIESRAVAPIRENNDLSGNPLPPRAIKPPRIENMPDQQKLDAWYITKVREVVEDRSDEELFQLRTLLCDNLHNSNDVDEVTAPLLERMYDERQAGVILGASMISACSDSYATIDSKHFPTSEITELPAKL